MDRLMGTIIPLVKNKGIESVEVKIVISTEKEFKVSDIQFQEGKSYTQYNNSARDFYTQENNNMHFNFLARGDTTLIVPYMSEIPFNTNGAILPCETEYITTPIKTDLLIHKPFIKSNESITIGPGLTGTSKRFELNTSISSYAHCIYDGYTSKQYINGVINNNTFIGRELRLANSDAKFTIRQKSNRKTTGTLYANKTRKEV